MKNPYLGLSTYTEESLKEYQFNGRAKASAVLAAMIRNNLFITLYGRSGIGKSSLLQAGVFPLLRLYGYKPIHLRLSEIKEKKDGKNKVKDIEKEKEDVEKSAACIILWKKLCEALKKDGIEYESWDKADKYEPDFNDLLVLRKLFAAGRFVKNGETVIPVIILDQFEEVLYKAPKAGDLLVRQLYALVNDKYNLTIPHPSWHTGNDFRIVVSIREDDLFLLEDIIDKRNCSGFKSNRYRLLPLSDEEAREVILNPLKEENVIPPEQEDEIVEKIISLSKGDGESVNTLMLSLTCYVLFENSIAKNKPILEELNKFKDNLDTYYKMVTKGLPERQRYYLEDHLVDDQGRRTSIYLSDLRSNAPKVAEELKETQTKETQTNTNANILTILNVNQNRVELIHDQLAATVAKSRANRKSKRARYLGIVALIAILLTITLYSLTIIPQNKSSIVSSKDKISLVNNIYIEEFHIDSLGLKPQDGTYNGDFYKIYDCPNLKTIKVNDRSANIHVFKCFNLTNLELPPYFKGEIKIIDCPNTEHLADTLRYRGNFYSSSQPFNTSVDAVTKNELLYSDELYSDRFFEHVYFDYDSINHRLILDSLPYVSCSAHINEKKSTNLKAAKTADDKLIDTRNITDSLKSISDIYVPYGCKEEFSQLIQFKPFKSIIELPFYHNIIQNSQDSFKRFFFTYIYSFRVLNYRIQANWKDIIILMYGVIIFLVTWTNRLDKLTEVKSRLIFGFSLVYGLPILTIISGFAAYCLVYYIISPENNIVAIYSSLIFALLVLLITCRNSFYYIWKSLRLIRKEGVKLSLNKVWRYIKLAFKLFVKRIRRHSGIIIAILSFVIIVPVICLSYIRGSERRHKYLGYIKEMEYSVRLPRILDELEEQHGSIFYKFFTDSLHEIKKGIKTDSLSLIHQLRSNELVELAQKNGFKILDKTETEISKVESPDGRLFFFRIDDCGTHQYAIFDAKNQKIDSITPKLNTDSISDVSFSPSKKTFIAKIGHNNLYSYSIPNKTSHIIHGMPSLYWDVNLINDSIFCFVQKTGLYLKKFYVDTPILELDTNVNSIFRFDFLPITLNQFAIVDVKNKIINVYDTKAESKKIINLNKSSGSVEYVEYPYVYMSKELYNIESDSVLYESNKFLYYELGKWTYREYNYRNSLIQYFDYLGNLLLQFKSNCSGGRLNCQESPKFFIGRNTTAEKDQYNIHGIINDVYDIYRLHPITKEPWYYELTEFERKIFDLPKQKK